MNKIAALFLLLVFAACNNAGTVNNTKTAEATAPVTKSDIQTWSGNIKGNIPVFVWFSIQDSVLAGELVYMNTRDRKPIKIYGDLSPAMCFFREFSKDGLITGTWSGTMTKTGFTGKWYASGSEKEYDFSLLPKDTALNNSYSFTASQLEGTYSYRYPGEGAMGQFSVKQLDKDHIIFNTSCVTDGPAHNIAELMDDTLAFANNKATYRSHDEFGNCEFTISFYNGFISVQTKEDAYECGFGHNAGVDGIFLKTSSTFSSDKPE